MLLMTRTEAHLFHALLLFIATVAQAQQNPFRFGHTTVKDGLSQSLIYAITQDHEGYLWVGTQDGLNRFDGNKFKVFKHDPFDSTTLTHNWIWTVQEDNHGDLWVGTFQGLCKYDRAHDRFIQFFYDMEDSTSISGNRTNFILKDKKGRLWISAWGRGLNLYDEKTNTFRRFLHNEQDANSLSDNFIRTLYCDHEGTVWVGTWNSGLNKVVEKGDSVYFQRYTKRVNYGLEAGNRITSIVEDQNGELWIASYESGVIRVDKSRTRFKLVEGFLSDDVNKVFCDRNNNIWIGSNNGLYFLDRRTNTFRHYVHDSQNPSGIGSNTIYEIGEDRSGIVWIGSNGLDTFDPYKNIFQTYQSEINNANSLSQNVVWSFCEDTKGKIWIGVESGPINIFDPVTKTFEHIVIKDEHNNIATNIHRMAWQGDVLWIGSFNTGLVKYDARQGKAKFYFGSHPSMLGKVAHVDEVLVDNQYLWVSSNDKGLFRLNTQTDEVEQFVHQPDNYQSLGSNFVNALFLDNKKNLWVGFWGGGVSVMDRKTKQFKNFIYDRKNKNGLSDQVVTSFTQQNDSIYWICTLSGLNKLNIVTGKFTHFFEGDDLANNAVYQMIRDDDGNYWISTNGGINKFDPQTNLFKTYTEEDGLQSNEFNANAALKSRTGDLYFGGVNGFNVFNPKYIKQNKAPLKVIIERCKVFDKTFKGDEEIKLNYNENFLSFQFTAIEFSTPAKVRYAYQLSKVDKDWNQVIDQHEAVYTNLDPGKYIFRVKASNGDGVWSEQEASLTVVIAPPFWKAWWFVTLVLAVIVLVAYGLHRYRLRQSLKLERLRNKIASDLHDEVGSSLTRISIYSELLQSGTVEQGASYLQNISAMSREIVSTMSDIVWSIDNRSDSFGALILRMKDFSSEVLQAKNCELHFLTEGIDEDKLLDPALKQNLYLIFKEAINNIVKHATASVVEVRMMNKEGQFTMTICDNGKGIQTLKDSSGHGLRNMRRRAKAIQADFEMTIHAGTTICIRRKPI
jgi:ligand-binding sensor domain-containing protein/signal transduction histidine kinase